MYLNQIVNSLRSTYKTIDIRIVTVKGQNTFVFLKILLSNENDIDQNDTSFFNSVSKDLQFIRKVMDVNNVDVIIINNLQNGTLELEGTTFEISPEEKEFLATNFETSNLYSKWTSDLYAKDNGLDTFPLLLIRAPFSTTSSGLLSSYGISSKMKGFETSKLIHSFLDSSSINNSNSRIVILLPVYCMLKEILSGYNLIIHNYLKNQISLRVLNRNPKSYPLSTIIDVKSNELITCHLPYNLIKEGSEISVYIDSLDLELYKKGILHTDLRAIELPKAIQYDSKEDVKVLIERDESRFFERKLYLSYDPITNQKNQGKEFDVMKTIDSFLNTDGGILIIGVDDNKKPHGLDGDYSILGGDRANFDKFENHVRKLIQDVYFKNSIVGELVERKRYDIDGIDICLIDIHKSPVPIFVFHCKNGQLFYVRQGHRSIRIDTMELSDYLKRHFCIGSVLDIHSRFHNTDDPL